MLKFVFIISGVEWLNSIKGQNLKKTILIVLSTLMLIVLTGCASKTTTVNVPYSSINIDESKAYIVFAYEPFSLLGVSTPPIIYEFNPKSGQQKLVINFDKKGKFFQEVTPGEHHYIIRRVVPAMALQEDMKFHITVNVEKGEKTYVDVQGLKVFTLHRALLESKLQGMQCTLDNLNKYNFKELSHGNNHIVLYESPMFNNINIVCEGDKVVNIYSGTLMSIPQALTLKSIEGFSTIRPINEFNQNNLLDIEELNSKYNLFHILHKDALQKYPFEIYHYSAPTNEHKYESIQTVVKSQSNLDSKAMIDITKKISDTFIIPNSSAKTKKLKIVFSIENYVSGNRAGRYFNLLIDNHFDSMASVQITAEYIDTETGKSIGKVKATRVLAIGILGGSSSGIVEDAINDILAYTEAVYIKK